MKAVFVHDHNFVYDKNDNKYYDGSGGAFSYKLWQRYLEVFDELTVVGRGQNQFTDNLVDATYENVTFNLIWSLNKPINRFLRRKSIERELTVVLKNVEFVIIRVPSTLGYIAQDICIKNNINYMLETVGCTWDAYWNHSSILGKIIAPFEYIKQKNSVNKSDYVLYVTKHFLQNRYPTKGQSVGISDVNLKNTIAGEVAQQFYKSVDKQNEFRVGLIGTFHVKYKGQHEALKALNYIVENNLIPNPRLYFVGTGDASWIVNIARNINVNNNIEVLGTLEAGSKGIFPFLDRMHVYIQPSKTEGLPRTVIEALSRGRLTLGSKVGGIPELLLESYLHESDDWKKLANQIVSLYNKSNTDWVNISKHNILKAESYLEVHLQSERVKFIKKALNNESV